MGRTATVHWTKCLPAFLLSKDFSAKVYVIVFLSVSYEAYVSQYWRVLKARWGYMHTYIYTYTDFPEDYCNQKCLGLTSLHLCNSYWTNFVLVHVMQASCYKWKFLDWYHVLLNLHNNVIVYINKQSNFVDSALADSVVATSDFSKSIVEVALAAC